MKYTHQIEPDLRTMRLDYLDQLISRWAAEGRLFDMDDPRVNEVLDERNELFNQVNPHISDPMRFLGENEFEEGDE